jgi:hypothetical protein
MIRSIPRGLQLLTLSLLGLAFAIGLRAVNLEPLATCLCWASLVGGLVGIVMLEG